MSLDIWDLRGQSVIQINACIHVCSKEVGALLHIVSSLNQMDEWVNLGRIPSFHRRSVGSGEQCRQVRAHRPTRVDALGGLHKSFGCESDRSDRCDPPVSATPEKGPRQGGKHGQYTGETVYHRWRILPVQIWGGSLLGLPQVYKHIEVLIVIDSWVQYDEQHANCKRESQTFNLSVIFLDLYSENPDFFLH